MLKPVLFCIALLLFLVKTSAQNKPKHENKFYKSPEGKIYVQKSMPVYIYLTTSPADSAQKYLLQSEASKEYTNPMYFDVEGFNSYRSPSAVDTVTKKTVYPKRDIIYEVYADNTSPVSKIHYGNSNPFFNKGKTYIKGSVTISISSVDALSGVENIYYSIDSSDYSIYKSPIALNDEKEYIIKYYAADHVGNAETEKRVVVITDFTKPQTKYSIIGDNFENTLSGTAQIRLSATDSLGSGIAAIKYKLDDNAEKPYSSAINSTFLDQGEHKLQFFSVDRVGNMEDKQVYNFYVDRTPPTVMQEVIGKSFTANGREYSSGRSQLKITSIDNKAGIKETYYSINNGPYIKYEKPVTLANMSGLLIVKSYSVDNVKNIGYSTGNEKKGFGSLPSYVDLNGPEVTYNFVGPLFKYNGSVFISSKTMIVLKASDKESGTNHIEYSVNNGEALTYAVPVKLTDEGPTEFQYTAFDNVDNTTTGNVNVTVDNSGPKIFFRFSTPAISTRDSMEVFPSFVSLFVAATDKLTGFDKMSFSLNYKPYKPFTGYIPALPKGKNRILIRANDKLGNISEKYIDFIVE